MKILNKLYLILIVAVFLACNPEDTDHLRIPDFTTGGTVDITYVTGSDFFDPNDLATPLQWSLLGKDGGDGSLIQSVEIFVYHVTIDGIVSDTVLWLDFDGAALLDQTTSAQSLVDLIPQLSALDDVGGGDRFEFFLNEIVMTNGDVFTINDTSDGLLTNRADFAWTIFVACPLSSPIFSGTYLYEPIDAGGFGVPPFGTPSMEVEIQIGEAPFDRFLELNYLADFAIGQPDMPFSFKLICGSVVVAAAQPTFLGCAGTLQIGPAATAPTYDDADDSELVMVFTDNTASDCGAGPGEISFRLTKVE